jgi:hypothetical protein
MCQNLCAAYDRFLALMDRAQEAIDRKDLKAVAWVEEQVTRLTAEMEADFAAVSANPSDQLSIASLEPPIRRALDRLVATQEGLADWLKETGTELGRLQQGAAAVHGYTAAIFSTPAIMERQV